MPLLRALEHLAGRARARAGEPALWDALRSLGPAFAAHPAALAALDPPVHVRELWAGDLRATRAANILRQAELARLLGALAESGVDSILYKGAAALDRLYADPGIRPMDDADLLVRPADRARAASVLERLAYEPVPIDAGRLGPVGASLHAARAFRRRVGQLAVEVDLHWQPISDARLRAAFPGAGEALWDRAVAARSSELPGLRLDPVDEALLTAAMQLFGHPWSHPLGYLDLHLIAGRLSHADWDVLAGRARAAGLAAPAYWGFRFAAELFGTDAPALTALAPAPIARRVGERLVGGDWLGLSAGRREMPARDLFVLVTAGAAGTARLLRAGLVDRETDGARRVATLDPRSSGRAALWLAQAALAAFGRRTVGPAG